MSDETTEREARQAAGRAGAVTASPRSAGELLQQLQMRQIELEIENDALRESVAALRQSDGWTELILDSVAEAMLVVDAQGRVVRANRGAHETFGYPAGSMPGLGVEALVPERFRTGHAELMARFMELPESRPMGQGKELSGLRRDGGEFPCEMGLAPMFTGERRFVVVSVVDLSLIHI